MSSESSPPIHDARRFVDPRALVTPPGIRPSGAVHRNPSVHTLYECAVQSGQATIMANGALRQLTAPYVGRAAKSSFYVRDPEITVEGHRFVDVVAWGDASKGRYDNLGIAPAVYHRLRERVVAHLSDADRLFVHDGISGRTGNTRLRVRLITDRAVGALFARHIFLRPDIQELIDFEPGWTLLHAPDVEATDEDGTHGAAFIITHVGERTTIIGGTKYNGQIKKSIFAVQNLRLPLRGVLTMHAGASEGEGGRTAIHAGLSGTGKTTLSNTGYPIADDQIVVDPSEPEDAVISNMEGGQYAKTENLRRDKEPEVFDAIRFGTTAENIAIDEQGHALFNDLSLGANGRVGYPLDFVTAAKPSGTGAGPSCITFLTADGFGVLPPVARLSVESAMLHFALGFTSKMPGTERGVVDPVPTFSAFFGLPFMPLKPAFYTELLAKVIERYGTVVWLVNTGWLGPASPERSRVDILVSKAIINAVRDGRVDLADSNFRYDPRFKMHVPRSVPGVDDGMLDPKAAWSDADAYVETANKLAGILAEQAAKLELPEALKSAVPEPR